MRSFSADMTKQGVKSDLRLLPQPLYRYEPTNKDSQVIDGALFAYVWTGGPLDPEVFLVIEARRAASGASWQFAPARFTNREATVKHKGNLVWRAEVGSPGIFDGVTTKALWRVLREDDRRRPRRVMTSGRMAVSK